MYFKVKLIFVIANIACISLVEASNKIEGCFVAKTTCEAFRSIKKQTNPNDIRLEPFKIYSVVAKNKPQESHYQLVIESTRSPLRWVSKECGHYIKNCRLLSPSITDVQSEQTPDYLLALSWQPTFCASHKNKLECKETSNRKRSSQALSLHGLWPQPYNNAYCGVDKTHKTIDRRKKWHLLPVLNLSETTRNNLKKVMPGYLSNLQRHEWIKHGTCYGQSADQYYMDAIALTQQINQSQLGSLLLSKKGSMIKKQAINAALEASFGKNVGTKVSMKCDRKGRFSELWFNLRGKISSNETINTLFKKAKPAKKGNCESGLVYIP